MVVWCVFGMSANQYQILIYISLWCACLVICEFISHARGESPVYRVYRNRNKSCICKSIHKETLVLFVSIALKLNFTDMFLTQFWHLRSRERSRTCEIIPCEKLYIPHVTVCIYKEMPSEGSQVRQKKYTPHSPPADLQNNAETMCCWSEFNTPEDKIIRRE